MLNIINVESSAGSSPQLYSSFSLSQEHRFKAFFSASFFSSAFNERTFMFLLCCKQSRDSTIKRDGVCIHIFHKKHFAIRQISNEISAKKRRRAVKKRDNCAMAPTEEELIKKKMNDVFIPLSWSLKC